MCMDVPSPAAQEGPKWAALLNTLLHFKHHNVKYSPMLPQEAETISSPCQAEALKRCLAENNGDHTRCRRELEAFSSSCGASRKDAQPRKG